MSVAALRESVANARASGAGLAVALIELAEAEPLLGHRQAVVRSLLEEAAALLKDQPALEGRVLLRLAHVKLSEADFEGVEVLATRAKARLATDRWRVLECDTLLARVVIRRNKLDEATRDLGELASDDDVETLEASRAVAQLAVGWAELSVERRDYSQADKRIDVLAEGLGDDEDLIEQRFTCQQLRAAVALAQNKFDRGCHALRDCVVIAKNVGSIEDELEMRIALAGALIERGDVIGRDEAEKHLQITRDVAQENGLDSLHMAALVGQAGLLAKKGQTKAALDRCIEIAKTAVEKQDLVRYSAAVAMMSGIYEQKGDLASALRTFADANATLRETLGDTSKDLFRPYITAFSERIGREKFQEVAEQVSRAAAAVKDFRRI